MSNRPLCAAFLVSIFAAVISRYAPLLLPLCVVLAALYAFVYGGTIRTKIAIGVLIAAASLITGFFGASHLKDPGADIYTQISLRASVREVSHTKSGNTKATATADLGKGGNRRVILYFNKKAPLEPGDIIDIEGALEPLSFPRNPGAYDEFLYLRSRKIYYKMFISDYTAVGKFFSPMAAIKRANAATSSRVDKLYPKDGAGIMRAMLLGDKTALDEDIAALYSDAGIYHILAISGLHVAIVGMAISRLLSAIAKALAPPRIKTALFRGLPVAAVAVMFGYAAFTGLGVATVRAVVMASCVAASGVTGRKADIYSSLSLAGLVLLIYEPLYIFDVGFLYSFSAVFGLAALGKPAERLFSFIGFTPVRKFLQKYLAYCVAAFLVTIPITAWFFFKISPISVIVNALLLPTIAITVVCGFVSLLLPPAALPAYGLLRLYQIVCALAVKVPFGVLLVGRPYILAIVIFCGAMALWGFSCKPFIVLTCAALSVALYFGERIYRDSNLTITMIDVGQGDSTAFSHKSRLLLIDGGGNFLKPIGDNTGKWNVAPYMNYLGKQKADAAFITHMDADHALGIIELLNENRVRRLYLGDVAYGEPNPEGSAYADENLYEIITKAANKHNIPIEYIKEGDKLSYAGDMTIATLNPPEGKTGKTNNQSLVQRVEYAGFSLIFTGDAESPVEARLVADYGQSLKADVLKVGHHGSKTSSMQDFVNAVNPQAAIIGVGQKNSYGHPNAGVVARLEGAGTSVFTTAQSGAITLKINKTAIRITTMSGTYNR